MPLAETLLYISSTSEIKHVRVFSIVINSMPMFTLFFNQKLTKETKPTNGSLPPKDSILKETPSNS